MLFDRIFGANNRRFRAKVVGGQGILGGKNHRFINRYADNYRLNRFDKKFSRIKILLIIAIIAIVKFFVLDPINCCAETTQQDGGIEESVEKILESLDLDLLDDLFEKYARSDEPLFNLILRLIGGNASSSFEELFQYIKKSVLDEAFGYAPLFCSVLAIVILLSIVDGLKGGRFKDSTVTVCNFIGNLTIIGVIGGYFFQGYTSTKSTMQTLTKEIETVFPIILTLMTASGANAGVSVFKPTIGFLLSGVNLIFTKILLPISVLIFVFSGINSFSTTIKTDKAVDLFKSVFKWIVGLSSVVFCFVISTQGVASSVYDNLSLKALKYAVGSSLPLINSLLSGGFDTVVASCVLVKNALGTLTLILLLYTVAMPVLKLVTLSLTFRLLAALAQSITSDGTVKFLSGAADCASYLATSLTVVAISYLITVLIAMCALGVTF